MLKICVFLIYLQMISRNHRFCNTGDVFAYVDIDFDEDTPSYIQLG